MLDVVWSSLDSAVSRTTSVSTQESNRSHAPTVERASLRRATAIATKEIVATKERLFDVKTPSTKRADQKRSKRSDKRKSKRPKRILI